MVRREVHGTAETDTEDTESPTNSIIKPETPQNRTTQKSNFGATERP
jgi:hypothetical protein